MTYKYLVYECVYMCIETCACMRFNARVLMKCVLVRIHTSYTRLVKHMHVSVLTLRVLMKCVVVHIHTLIYKASKTHTCMFSITGTYVYVISYTIANLYTRPSKPTHVLL